MNSISIRIRISALENMRSHCSYKLCTSECWMILERHQACFQDRVLLLCDLRGSFCFRPIFLHSSDVTRWVDENSHVSHLYHIMFLHLRKIYKTNTEHRDQDLHEIYKSPSFSTIFFVNPHFQSVSTPDGPKRCGVSVHPRKRDAIEMPLKNWWMFCELRPLNIWSFLTQKKKTDFGCFVKS